MTDVHAGVGGHGADWHAHGDGAGDDGTRPPGAGTATRDGVEESLAARRRRKFAVGALEQAAGILGAMSASILVVGLIGPYVAAFTGASGITPAALVGVAVIALTIAVGAGVGAMVLKGLSRRADDDGRFSGHRFREVSHRGP